MNAIAVAVLATSLFAVASAFSSISKQNGSTWWQRFLAVGGIFGFVWSASYLLGV